MLFILFQIPRRYARIYGLPWGIRAVYPELKASQRTYGWANWKASLQSAVLFICDSLHGSLPRDVCDIPSGRKPLNTVSRLCQARMAYTERRARIKNVRSADVADGDAIRRRVHDVDDFSRAWNEWDEWSAANARLPKLHRRVTDPFVADYLYGENSDETSELQEAIEDEFHPQLVLSHLTSTRQLSRFETSPIKD